MFRKEKYVIKPLTIISLAVLILAISIGGRECGGKSKSKSRAGSSTEWAGVIAPSNVGATVISGGAINVTWQDNSNNEDLFRIERKTGADGVYIEIGTVQTNITSFLDNDRLCPGNNYYYRLRAYMTTGDISSYSPEGSILLSAPIFSLACGTIYSYAQIAQNTPLWAWGWNGNYAATSDSEFIASLPVNVGTDIDWVEVAGGDGHQLALKSEGTLWGWGGNYNGQLGLGDQEERNTPTMIDSDFDFNIFDGVAEVVCGAYHSAARKSDGTIWTWGWNNEGELGIGDTEDATAPLQVLPDSDFSSITSGYWHVIARRNNNTLWSWGSNAYGQLGLGNYGPATNRLTPTPIGTQSDWSMVKNGGWHTIALKTNQTLWSWGCNYWGQVGLGYWSETVYTPTAIGTDSDWSSVTGGGEHSIGHKTNGTLWVWGSNVGYYLIPAGQLGVGSGVSELDAPVMLGTDTDWDKSAANRWNTLLSKNDGSIWGCGDNISWELGLGDYFPRYTPAMIKLGVPFAPSELTGTVASAYQINLSWEDNSSDEIVFRLERKTGLAGTYVEIGLTGASITSYPDASVSPDYTYYYRVRAYNVYGNGPYSAEVSLTSLQTPPLPPTALTCTAITSTAITCNWDDVLGEMGYRITRSLTDTTNTYSTIAVVGADVITYTDTTLDPMTQYYYKVIAYNSIGDSDPSISGTATTPNGPPNIPSPFLASVTSATCVSLSWGNVGGETGYKVERRSGIGNPYSIITTTTVADVIVYSDTSVAPANSYTYRVRAYNGDGDGGYTPERTVNTPDIPPNAPTVLTCTVVTSTRINLAWDDTSSNEIGFRLERGPDGVNFSLFRSLYANTTSYADMTVDPQNTYYYRVRAYNSVGESGYSPIDNGTTPDGPPNSPQTLTATAISQVQINLGWSNVPSETGYKIERKTGVGGSYSVINTRGADVLTYADTTVTASTTYYYRVKAYNTNGDSPYYSPEVNVRTWSTSGWLVIAAAKGDFSVGIKQDRTLWTWGVNDYGQLGYAYAYTKNTPTQVGSYADWSAIAAGEFHTIALKTNKTLWSWGNGYSGQLGRNPGGWGYTYVPGQINSSQDWNSIAVGSMQTFAKKDNGTLWACGFNDQGELGIGDTIRRDTVTQIGNSSDWSMIYDNFWHGVAIKNNTTLWTWGWNASGALGNGNTTDMISPVQVSGSGWRTASGGGAQDDSVVGDHTLAIKADNTLWSWGYNGYGQLGLGDNTDRLGPAPVGAEANWSVVSAGLWHSLACKQNGTLWAWGRNNYGQLGLGDLTNKTAPLQVGTAVDWSIISAGYNHCLALKNDYTLWSWGNNNRGQLGVGDTVNRNTPTQVLTDGQ